jgi:predicted DNA-binding ribbon-helix-helix protein
LNAEDEPPAVGKTDNFAHPIFRTVLTPDGRQALRLEAAFWDSIEHLAKREGRKTTDYMREMLGEAKDLSGNLSSGVRSVVAKRLLRENERMAPLSAQLSVVKLMQLAPTPSFALDRGKHLIRVNDEFVRYLRTILARSGPVEKAELRLDRPTETFFAEGQIGIAVECGLSIHMDNHERRTNARIIVPPPGPATILVGFVLG